MKKKRGKMKNVFDDYCSDYSELCSSCVLCVRVMALKGAKLVRCNLPSRGIKKTNLILFEGGDLKLNMTN